uniref:Uncharacterized protein n=1 Tax=Meloidogyne floridensis TaxID=298350 RepID=A0A915PB49_9BILA
MQTKQLPSELLFDIFKAADGAIMESLPNFYEISSMLKQREFEKLWINQVNNLLTSSSIVYIFVGIIFKRRWLLICEESKKVELSFNGEK